MPFVGVEPDRAAARKDLGRLVKPFPAVELRIGRVHQFVDLRCVEHRLDRVLGGHGVSLFCGFLMAAS